MKSAAPARTRSNSPMRTHGSGGSLCGYACGRMRGRLDTHLGAGTASADARSEAPDPCRHAALSAVQHSPSRTRNARSASCCAACSMLLAVACATACGTTQRWPPARADALRGRGKAARRAGGRRSGKRATAARGARGLHDPPNKKLITCIWVGVFETIVVAQRSSHLGERDEAWKPPRHEFSSVACCEPVVGDRPAILHLPMPTVVHGAPGTGSNPKSAFGTLK